MHNSPLYVSSSARPHPSSWRIARIFEFRRLRKRARGVPVASTVASSPCSTTVCMFNTGRSRAHQKERFDLHRVSQHRTQCSEMMCRAGYEHERQSSPPSLLRGIWMTRARHTRSRPDPPWPPDRPCSSRSRPDRPEHRPLTLSRPSVLPFCELPFCELPACHGTFRSQVRTRVLLLSTEHPACPGIEILGWLPYLSFCPDGRNLISDRFPAGFAPI